MNLIEYLREQIVTDLFKTTSFEKAWSDSWRSEISNLLPNFSPREIIDLGDHLSTIFLSTRSGSNANRGQSTLAAAGSSWECLITWYLNICTIGTRILAVKKTSQLPEPLKSSIQVNYSNSQTNSESDIVVIVFPNHSEFTESISKNDFSNYSGININPYKGSKIVKSGVKELIDKLVSKYFNEFEIGIVQCKTNWNENAQVPMLWDMIYQTNGFRSNNISIGSNGYSMRNLASFSYSFATVPTKALSIYTAVNLPVLRVRNLTGGNYWGFQTRNSVAFSIKEIFNRNFQSGFNINLITDIEANLELISKNNYFRI